MTIRPTGIVFDAQDVPALAEFWRQATGYELTSKDDWFAELVPDGAGLKHIFIFRIKSGKTSKNRCHVDFETDDRGDEVAPRLPRRQTRRGPYSRRFQLDRAPGP